MPTREPHGSHANKTSHRLLVNENTTHGHIDEEYASLHGRHDHAPMQPHELDEHDPVVTKGGPRATPHSDKIAMGKDQHPYPSDMQPEPGGESE